MAQTNKTYLTLASLAFMAVICMLSFETTEAAVFTQRATFHPAHPGKCFDNITKRSMLPNKEYRPKGICAAMTCDIETQTINIETCPSIDMPECVELPTNPSWTFPKCCPQFKCTDFKTGKQFIVSV